MARVGRGPRSPIRKVFAENVQPRLAGPASGRPRLLVLNGPQGSRKTTLAGWLTGQLGMERPYVMEGDDLFTVLPGYERFAREHGGVAAQNRYLGDYLELRQLIGGFVRKQRSHLAMVGVFDGADFMTSEVQPFRQDGYRTDLATTVIPPALALAHLVVRDARQAARGEVRLPLAGPERQRQFRDGTLSIIRTMEAGDLFDGMHLVTADGRIITRERVPDGPWVPRMPGGLAARAEQLVGGPWTLHTAIEHVRLMDEGRRALATPPGPGDDVRRDLLRAAGADAADRGIRGFGLVIAVDAIARAVGPVTPVVALHAAPTVAGRVGSAGGG